MLGEIQMLEHLSLAMGKFLRSHKIFKLRSSTSDFEANRDFCGQVRFSRDARLSILAAFL
jgi:hypothetical protein